MLSLDILTFLPCTFYASSSIFLPQVGRLENAIGWYHSHPGYGCWLSGIDVSTQMLNQNFQEPFVAIVIDPVRTISAGKVCLGAFRTYPKVCNHLSFVVKFCTLLLALLARDIPD